MRFYSALVLPVVECNGIRDLSVDSQEVEWYHVCGILLASLNGHPDNLINFKVYYKTRSTEDDGSSREHGNMGTWERGSKRMSNEIGIRSPPPQ